LTDADGGQKIVTMRLTAAFGLVVCLCMIGVLAESAGAGTDHSSLGSFKFGCGYTTVHLLDGTQHIAQTGESWTCEVYTVGEYPVDVKFSVQREGGGSHPFVAKDPEPYFWQLSSTWTKADANAQFIVRAHVSGSGVEADRSYVIHVAPASHIQSARKTGNGTVIISTTVKDPVQLTIGAQGPEGEVTQIAWKLYCQQSNTVSAQGQAQTTDNSGVAVTAADISERWRHSTCLLKAGAAAESTGQVELNVFTRVLDQTSAAPAPTAKESPAGGVAYVQPADVEAAFQERGITIGGSHFTVLDVTCTGAGFAQGAFPYQRYHIFECYVSTRASKDAQFRVTTTAAGANRFNLSYEPV
jgi:hypothetical protein